METKREVLGDVLENKLDYKEVRKEVEELEKAIKALDYKLAQIQFSDQIGVKRHQAYLIRRGFVRDLSYNMYKIIDYIQDWGEIKKGAL